MDTGSASTSAVETMGLRDRRGRADFSYMAASSDSDSEASDGDPPYFAAGAPPAAAPAPAPAPVQSETKKSPPRTSSASAPAGASGGKRSFDELEDIIFSHPKSFVALAGQIGESRNVQLLVSDDRTHKASSAYMHITCAYRGSGCPFILKLCRAKEGGWMVKGSKAPEYDPKQRSQYRCRHPAGSLPDHSHGTPIPDWLAVSNSTSTSHPEPGTKPRAARPRSLSLSNASGADPYTAAGSDVALDPRLQQQHPAPLQQVESLAGKAPRSAQSQSRITVYKMSETDRALAPPFIQRGIELQAQIAPALSPIPAKQAVPTGPQAAGASPIYYAPSASPYPPPVARAPSQDGRVTPAAHPYALDHHATAHSAPPRPAPPPHAHSQPLPRAHYPTSAPPPSTYTTPVVAVADPTALPEWSALLSAFGDSSLYPLAKVLASPAVACTPAQFFAPEVDEKLQSQFLDQLPERAMGLWPKLRFAKRMREDGKSTWEKLQEQRRKDGPGVGYVSGVKRSALPQEIPPSRGLLAVANGLGYGTPSPSASPSQPPSSRAHPPGPAGTAMDVDPSPSTPQQPASATHRPSPLAGAAMNPPPPPSAANGI
ncbi:hypothetical protein JCM10213_006701 [Rhodosporidiobolus nylandii]